VAVEAMIAQLVKLETLQEGPPWNETPPRPVARRWWLKLLNRLLSRSM